MNQIPGFYQSDRAVMDIVDEPRIGVRPRWGMQRYVFHAEPALYEQFLVNKT